MIRSLGLIRLFEDIIIRMYVTNPLILGRLEMKTTFKFKSIVRHSCECGESFLLDIGQCAVLAGIR